MSVSGLAWIVVFLSSIGNNNMSDTLIKTQNGTVLARIRIESNDVQRIYKLNGEFVGSYNPSSNTTHYPNGSVFCQGNALTALIDF